MKEIYVAFSSKELEEEFNAINQKQLLKAVHKTINLLKENPETGTKIPKKLWPKEYIQKHAISNLWKTNLTKSWRLIYTIQEDKIVIISIILEWLNHKEYERKFKY